MPGVWQKVFKFSSFCGNIRENLAKKTPTRFFSFRRNIRENLAKGWTADVGSGIEQQKLSCPKELHSCTDYIAYDEESDHSNKAVRKTPEIESGHKVSEEVKWT